MKNIHITTLDPDNNGINFGPLSNPNDLNLAQAYAHEHVEQVTLDFLNKQSSRVAGFNCEVGSGIDPVLTITAPGRAYDEGGASFELASDAELEIAESDELARIDLVYGLLQEAVAAVSIVRPFVRLRTLDEYEDAVPPYTPAQMNAPTELQNIVTVGIRTGTPSSTPATPGLQANEVGLYLIKVGKNVTGITQRDVVDIRNKVPHLIDVRSDVNDHTLQIHQLNKAIESLPDAIQLQLGTLAGGLRSLSEILADLQNRLDRAALPEVLRPKIPRWDPESGKISAAGALEDTTPVVDIELNTEVAFGDVNVALNVSRFIDKARFPRLVQVSGGAAHESNGQALTLADVFDLQSDGSGDFLARSAILPARRSRATCAARDGRYVEVFGGLAENNSSKLGDWYTYDSVNDTLTLRTLTGAAIPAADRAAMFSVGDGNHVLICAAGTGVASPPWFYVHAGTGVVTALTGSIPTGSWFFGALLGEKVLICSSSQTDENDPVPDPEFWLFDVGDQTFEEIGVTGNVPTCRPDYSAGCYFQANRFVLVEFEPGVVASGKTYIFDLPSLTWTLLTIPPPYAGTESQALPIARFRMANVNGRPLLTGGLLFQTSDLTNMRVWEISVANYGLPNPYLKKPRWTFFDTSVPPLQDAAFCSTVPASSGVANGDAFLFAGQGDQVNILNAIYASVQGGLIETVLDGEDAITLAPSSTFASFTIPERTASWDVAGYVASLIGSYQPGQVKLEVSFDDGDHFHVVTPDTLFLVSDSDSPGVRQVRITLYGFGTSKPVLSKLIELFDQDGVEVEARTVLRFTAQLDAPHGLYLSRTGAITLSTTIVPSTPDKALLMKVTSAGAHIAPLLKLYVNKRKAHVRYRDTVGIIAPQVPNDLAVEPSFVRVIGVRTGDGFLYDVTVPEMPFDETIELTGVSEGDDYIVEVEG